jgi:hypothetical protein
MGMGNIIEVFIDQKISELVKLTSHWDHMNDFGIRRSDDEIKEIDQQRAAIIEEAVYGLIPEKTRRGPETIDDKILLSGMAKLVVAGGLSINKAAGMLADKEKRQTEKRQSRQSEIERLSRKYKKDREIIEKAFHLGGAIDL